MYICLIDVRMFFAENIQPLSGWGFCISFKKGDGGFKKSSSNPVIKEKNNRGKPLWSKRINSASESASVLLYLISILKCRSSVQNHIHKIL